MGFTIDPTLRLLILEGDSNWTFVFVAFECLARLIEWKRRIHECVKRKSSVCSFEKGGILFGDSPEYASVAKSESLGFDLKADINAFMIDEAAKIMDLPSWEVETSWGRGLLSNRTSI